MKVSTSRFGTLDITDSEIIQFSDGLYGFEKETQFTLLPFNPNVESPMEWMQSLKSSHLAFVITDPYMYLHDYKPKLSEEDKKRAFEQINILQEANEEARAEVSNLKNKFAKHDMNVLSLRKPKLIENIINKGTKGVLNDFENLTSLSSSSK